MLSCKEVCHFVSESLDQQLPWYTRLRVRLHLFICKACRRMVKQMALLQTAAWFYGATDEQTSTEENDTLSENARSRILKQLQQANSGSADHNA
ncbi:MAG: zf-HC2 domain-containing protein [Gammaproteobacteria bacterium]|nr:zf-HC2 domain-containing protein [Gammaproteobacteria bacterium]